MMPGVRTPRVGTGTNLSRRNLPSKEWRLRLFEIIELVVAERHLYAEPTKRFVGNIRRQAIKIRQPAPVGAIAVNQIGKNLAKNRREIYSMSGKTDRIKNVIVRSHAADGGTLVQRHIY